MIWNAIKFITLSEIIGWVTFLVITVVLWSFGIRAEGAGQAVMLAVWIILFAGTYQLLKRRRKRRAGASELRRNS